MTGKELEKSTGIPIDVFFKTYYGIEDEDKLGKLKRCSHRTLNAKAKKYGCTLERVWSDEIESDEVIRGDVIIVTDVEHNNGLYVNPRRKKPCFIPVNSAFEYPINDELTEEDYLAINEYYELMLTRELYEQYSDMLEEKPKIYKLKKGE